MSDEYRAIGLDRAGPEGIGELLTKTPTRTSSGSVPSASATSPQRS